VTIVVPARDRDVAHLPNGAIVVDDGSLTPIAGAAVRHDVARGAGAARNAGARLVTTPLVAFLDSDTRPRAGWLDALLPHFADPRVALAAPRIVAARATTRLGRYEAAHSPLDRGPLPARVVPHGRVPFVPGAALVMRTQLARFDETLTGGEDVDLVWRLHAQGHHVRYEPAAEVEHAHRTDARAWLARRAYYGRTAAPLARRHPGNARPLHLSPWTAAAWLALLARRPGPAAAITATATALLARELRDPRLAARLVADALVRTWWPLALARPKLLAAALLAGGSPLRTLDDVAYGWGVWQGCIRERTLDPLLPDLTWRTVECSADTLIQLAETLD
jgi:mycofactocin system glycosyltransferase